MKTFLKQHWVHVTSNFALDALIFCCAFLVGIRFRLPEAAGAKLGSYWPGIALGALLFPSIIYIFGLYSPQSGRQSIIKRFLLLGFGLVLTAAVMFGMFYIKKSITIGRGVMFYSWPVAYFAVLIHHSLLLRFLRTYRERVAFIVTNSFDELESRLFQSFGKQNLDLVGIVHYDDYRPTGEMKVLGRACDLPEIVQRHDIKRILCTNKSIHDPAMCKIFCELRYSGIMVNPLISLFEEIHQMVPLELITSEWLLHASTLPHVLYVNKIKRGFDIATSLAGLIFLGPIMLLGMLAVKVTSPGPIFYRQTRCGRFGKLIKVIKLRTMRVDAEKNGAVWASWGNDSRVTLPGAFLRKYRVDEIPQLINVLRGEMSFVGPRPERPEFIADLSQQIPFFQERLMVQPGITGWAQVNYPYGSSIEDARRKLEYDLYYTKNMSLFLDVFILLDTVRIILNGGLGEHHKKELFDTAFLRVGQPSPQSLERVAQ